MARLLQTELLANQLLAAHSSTCTLVILNDNELQRISAREIATDPSIIDSITGRYDDLHTRWTGGEARPRPLSGHF
jgi:hypothetical protein